MRLRYSSKVSAVAGIILDAGLPAYILNDHIQHGFLLGWFGYMALASLFRLSLKACNHDQAAGQLVSLAGALGIVLE